MEDVNDDNGASLAHRETCAAANALKRSVTENIIKEETSIATLKYLLKVSPLKTLLYMFIFHVLVSLFERQYLGCISETVMQSKNVSF